MKRETRRLISILLSAVFIAQTLLVMLPQASLAATPPQSQRSTAIIVESNERNATPGVYWYMIDNGNRFQADTNSGPVTTANIGTCANPYPANALVEDDLDINRWPAQDWNGLHVAALSDITALKVEWAIDSSYTPASSSPLAMNAEKSKAYFKTYTGGSHDITDKTPAGTLGTGCPKYVFVYNTPVKLTWSAKAYEQKEIDVSSDETIQVGTTKQLSASVRTTPYGLTTGSSSNVTSSGTTWASSNTAVATVNESTGLVTAEAVGTTTIRATWRGTGERGFNYEISDTASVTVTSAPVYNISGDFDILPSTIDWGTSFSLHPKDFVIPSACAYQFHEYRIEKDGSIWTSNKVTSQSSQSNYSYSSYPYNLGVGSNYVTIKITATCSGQGTVDTGWTAGKNLNINARPNNQPPQFSAGFFKEYNRTGINPDNEVAIGTRINLRIIQDMTKNPPWPHDPDGDPISFTWLFTDSTSSWIRSLPSQYGAYEYDQAHYNLIATQLGYHSVTVIARDSFGAETRRNVAIHVIPENPIPQIDGPTTVKVNRPLSTPFSGMRSYSPIGRTIVDYIWENKKDKYTTVGTETIKLDVVDSSGLRSLTPASHTLTVLPDDPPVAVLNVQSLGIRGQSYEINNNSYSPDGDTIVTASYRYKYDHNNNGFDDDLTWTSLGGTLAKATITPSRVGQYLIEVAVTEDFGKIGSTSVILDVTNQAPSVTFLLEGQNNQPEPDNNKLNPAQEILNSWSLYDTNTTHAIPSKIMWTAANGTLSAGLGKLSENPKGFFVSYDRSGYTNNRTWMYPYQNNGYGPNALSGYRAIQSGPYTREPLLYPTTKELTTWSYVEATTNQNFFIRTNKSNLYYQAFSDAAYNNGNSFFAINKSKLGNYKVEHVCNGCTYPTTVHSYTTSPFDYMLMARDLRNVSPKPGVKFSYYWRSYTAMINKDWSKASFIYTSTNPSVKVLAYEVSDQTVYQLVKWYCEGCNEIENESSRYDAYVLELRTYDLFTGELIQNTSARGIDIADTMFNESTESVQQRLYTKGDNLVYFRQKNASTLLFVEYDRYGNVVKQKEIIIPAAMNGFNNSMIGDSTFIFRGAEGEWYGWGRLSTIVSGTTSYRGTYIYKIDSNYNLVWTVVLGGVNPTASGSLSSSMGDPSDDQFVLVVNPMRREIIVRSVTINGFGYDLYTQAIQMDTGALSTFPYGYSSQISSFGINWAGDYIYQQSGSYTSDGYRTTANGTHTLAVYNNSNQIIASIAGGGGVLATSGPYATVTDRIMGGGYVGDGMYMQYLEKYASGYQIHRTYIPYLIKGTPTTVTQPFNGFKLGQFISTETLADMELSWSISMDRPREDTNLAGMSFRMTNAMNRYAAESDGATLYLSRYVNGVRTVLASSLFNIQLQAVYNMKVTMIGSQLKVYVNGVEYLSFTDATFTSGKFGPFSNKSYVDFSNISQKQLAAPTSEWMTNFAIWEGGSATASVRLASQVYSDPEHDPRAGNYEWSVLHTPKFLNNQGLSTLHNQTLSSPALTFDKIGNYRVTLRAQDDPHPSYPYPSTEFDEYRKYSNAFWQIITVHRRPVAAFSLNVNSTTKYVEWTDTSYDPDRWISSTNYSTEATGVNYQTSRGVLERKYYYVDPSGVKVDQKLVTPSTTGTYRIGLQVKDEYGAWSHWVEQSITIVTPVVPNQPPTPGFTVSPSSGYRGTTFTINSTASDPEDGARTNLTHAYYIRNVAEGSSEVPVTSCVTCRTSWTHNFSELGVYAIRQVVTDSKGVSAQMTRNISVLNRPPVAQFDWSPKPVWEGDVVNFVNQSSDPDSDSLLYNWRILNASGTVIYTSTALHPTYRFIQSGMYSVILTAMDDYTQSEKIAVVEVLPLVLEPDIRHTDRWLIYHHEHGHETATHPKDYYSGEQLILSAVGSDTDITKVEAELDTMGKDNKRIVVLTELQLSTITNRFEGVLYDAVFSSISKGLPLGTHQVVFKMTYANGVVLTKSIPITIIGHVQQTVNVHRLH